MLRMTRRTFMKSAAAAAALTAGFQRGAFAAPAPSALVNSEMRDQLAVYLEDLCAWVMTLDVGSNALKNTGDTATSIFINGNFARMLMASYRITGNRAHLDEALRWCDTFCSLQQPAKSSKGEDVGYWGDCSPAGNIYFGDAGTATHALAAISHHAGPDRQATYRSAMERYARFVIDGCTSDPQGQGREVTDSWVIREGDAAGALGCGYYRGKLSTEPYTIAAATTGGAFMSELHAITEKPEYRDVAAGAVRWLLSTRKDDGEIPYTLAGSLMETWPLDTMSYCTEGFIAADLLLDDEDLRAALRRDLAPSVQWMLAGQNADGSWGELRSQDQQRSPRAVSLLSWAYEWAEEPEPVAESVRRYCAYLLDPANSKAYGVKELVRTSGFVGLAVADILQPHCTF